MGSVAKSKSSAGIEFGTSIGIQQLLTPTAISALPASLSSAIPGAAVNGMRLVIRVYNHTATGTITVTGKAPGSQGAVTETTTTLALPDEASGYVDYTTTAVFGSVDSSGVAIGSGLTNGTVVIYGVQAASRLLVGESKLHDKYTNVSPYLQTGIYVKDQKDIRTTGDPEWEFTGPLMANQMLLWLLTGYSSNLTYTTVPASPTALHASATAVTSGNESATSQPTAPGMIIQIVLGGAPTTAATVTVTGTIITGESITETVVASTLTAGTYYSKNVFTSIATNGIAWGSYGGTATVTVNGIFCASISTATPAADSMQTFVLENYDSTASKVASGCLTDEWSIEGGLNKEAKVSAKGKCQAIYKVGNVTSSTNQVTNTSLEPENALTGWQTLAYIDDLSSTTGTTLQTDVIDYKFTMKPMWKTLHKSAFNPPYEIWSAAYLNYREAELEMNFDMTQATYYTEYVAFSRKRFRNIRIWVRGTAGYGVDGGTAYYPGFYLDVVGKWVEVPEIDWSSGKESVQIKLKLRVFYNSAKAYAWKFTDFCQLAGGWT